ncbi:MAG: nicotinamide mononucleotide transporter [Clostridia bacterium]|nr:nicotinamide mononucleotide transporter [Clostridia bacterium]
MHNPFKKLSKFEFCLWLCSMVVVILCYIFSPQRDLFSTIGSLIGVTALIFTAKGDIWGQILIIIFAVFYGVVSFSRQYYGEMITYLGMSAPMAVVALVAWIRHPSKKNRTEVEVKKLSVKNIIFTFIFAIAVTVIFYFILSALKTAEILLSTVSITTSVLAATLTYLRSPYYALGYAANDLVLIGLWILAGNLAMIICFVVFFVNDMYGFFNWLRMQKRQQQS